MILLTSAPRAWANKVLQYLKIDDCFEIKFTGDQFKSKEDIFRILAQRYNPANITSIGDQEKTDLLPAQELGMRTLKINNPTEIEDMMYIGGILAH